MKVMRAILTQINKQTEVLKTRAEEIATELKSPANRAKSQEIDSDVARFLSRR